MDISAAMSKFSPIFFERDPEELKKFIFRYEKMHTASLSDLAEAAEKLDNESIGWLNAGLDSSFSFFVTACSSFLRLITHMALAIIQLIPAMCSDKAAGYLRACFYRGIIDLGCVVVGAMGVFTPHVGHALTVKLNEYVISHILKKDIPPISDSAKLLYISGQLQLLQFAKVQLENNVDLA